MIGPRALLSVACLLLSSSAAAAEVVLVSDAGEVFDRRVIAEVRSVGLDVRSAGELPDLSADVPVAEPAVAWVEVDASAGRVRVWMRKQGRAVALGSVPLRAEAGDSLRVAERVRALLQPVAARVAPPAPKPNPAAQPNPAPQPDPAAAPPEPPPQEPPPVSFGPPSAPAEPEPAPDDDPPDLPRWTIELAPAYVRQTTSPAMSVMLRGSWRFSPPWSVEVLALLPLVASEVRLDPDSAALDARLAGAGLVWQALSAAEVPGVELRFGAGMAAAFVEARGRAGAGASSHDTSAVTALPYGGFTASFVFSRHFAVMTSSMAGVSLPRAEILFRDTPVTTWGWPLVTGMVGLEARL